MCNIISGFFPGISHETVKASFKGHIFYCGINSALEGFYSKIFRRAYRDNDTESPDKLCISCDVNKLMKLYGKSITEAIRGIVRAEKYIFGGCDAPVFDRDFKGNRKLK